LIIADDMKSDAATNLRSTSEPYARKSAINVCFNSADSTTPPQRVMSGTHFIKAILCPSECDFRHCRHL